jgi:sulfate permease, SulP family
MDQLRGYDLRRGRSDLGAGLTVGAMLVPQGMAYALIAGVPPIYGLYASLVPLVAYALLGTSRQLAVGPVAMISLLVAAGIGPLASGDPQRYVELAVLLALMVGVLQLAMGLLRFGFLTSFLSLPVLAGFTSAAALIIGASQLRHLSGVDLPQTNHVHFILLDLGRQLDSIHPATVAVGAAAIGLLVGLRRAMPSFPAAAAVVAAFTLLAVPLGLDGAAVRLVGSVPGGLPVPGIPTLDPAAIATLLPVALAISLVGFMESIAVAKVYATRHGYRIDPNQELVALGGANLAGAFFQAFPTTGGFSRSAVNDRAGARTTVATLVSAGVVALVLLFFTGLFRSLPNAVLAAIVITALASLFQWQEAVHLWRTDRRDFAVMMATFAATLGLGIEEGIIVGVVVSLGTLVYETSRPHTAVLGRLPGTETFRNLARHPDAERPDGIIVYRLDAAFCFANAEFLGDEVRTLALQTPRPRTVVFDFHAVNGMDSTALQQLESLLQDLEAAGIAARFAGVKGPVLDRMVGARLHARIGADRFHHEVAHAVAAAGGLTEPAGRPLVAGGPASGRRNGVARVSAPEPVFEP